MDLSGRQLSAAAFVVVSFLRVGSKCKIVRVLSPIASAGLTPVMQLDIDALHSHLV